MGVTRDVAEFATTASFDDFDPNLVAHVKNVLLSGVGMTLAGVESGTGKAVLNYVKECSAPEEAGVIGAGFRTSVEYAALANGTTSHATELEDDTRAESMYSVGIFPSILALGEKLHLSGREVIEAFVVAWDIAAKLALAAPGMFTRGLAPWSAFSTVGVAACSAKVLGLDVAQTTMAVSIAASHACGLVNQVGTGSHLYESGLAGRNGISSALLAKHGLTGQAEILEIPMGYLDGVAGVSYPDLKLGAPYRARDIEIKKYPCCMSQMHPIDSFVDLIEANGISAGDVQSVQVDVPPAFAIAGARFQHPKNEDEARFSLAHSIASCFLDGKPWLDSYTTEKANNPQVRAFRDKVKIVVHPEWGTPELADRELPIVVSLKSGAEYTTTTPRTSEPIVVSDSEVLDKYLKSAVRVVPRNRAERIAEQVLFLEKVPDVTQLMSLLTFPDKG